MTPPGRAPLLELADPEFEWKRYERFSLDLVRALPDVRDAHLYGKRGERQKGIDIHADLLDGRVRTIQCRRVEKFNKTSARKVIAATTYTADEHEVWCTCPMSAGARDLLDQTPGWGGQDIEDLSSMVRSLPREIGRWLVEDHLGVAARRRLLGPDGDLAVVPARHWFRRRDDDDALLSTDQQLVGRDDELAALVDGLASDAVRIVLLPGRAGIGKTRLLRAIAEHADDERVLLLRPGTGAALLGEELPHAPFVFLVDDADRRPDLPLVLGTVFGIGERHTVILTTRPQHVPKLRSEIIGHGVAGHAICELDPLGPLTRDAAAMLAATLMGEDGPLSRRLGQWTRDVPALCVLGARLVRAERLDPAHLATQEAMRREILDRFREELIGDVAPTVDPARIRALLPALSAVQPVDLEAADLREWLAGLLGCSAEEVDEAARALDRSGLLAGPGVRRRVVPELLSDFVVFDACVADSRSTGYAERLLQAAPAAVRPRILANLSELDWRLERVGTRPVLDEVLTGLRRDILTADAWKREEMLKQLADAAPYLSRWIVELARDVLDHPAAEVDIGFGHIVDDAGPRSALIPLLASAGLDLSQTKTAIALLWEVGRGGWPRQVLGGLEPLHAAARFGDYELGLPYAEQLLELVEELLADPREAEGRRELPVKLLRPMTKREGTRSEARGHSIALDPFVLKASAVAPLRARLRNLLAAACRSGGERTRAAAAELLGDMLTQPRGFFGRQVAATALTQWRDEQILLLAEIDAVLATGPEALVALQLRDDLEWHARYSAIRGVKSRARAILRRHPPTSDELLARLLTHGIARLDDPEIGVRRYRATARRVAAETPRARDLLDRVDATLDVLSRAMPETHAHPGELFGQLAAGDGAWALDAARVLVEEPGRPSAVALGGVLSEALAQRPEAIRTIVHTLQASRDPVLRRLAADHVARLRWVEDLQAPERELAVAQAADEDPFVVRSAVLAAHRLADTQPALARRIIMAITSLADRQIGEDVCMVLSHDLGVSEADEDTILDRLVECPEVEYWHDRFVVAAAKRRPRRILRYFLDRLAHQRDDVRYQPVPFDGLSADPVAAHPDLRAAILREVIDAACDLVGTAVELHVAELFWSFAADTPEAFDAIGEAFLTGSDQHCDATDFILADAEAGVVLERPQWIASLLENVAVERLECLLGALHAAVMSNSKQGTPGQPFPQDVHLRDKARQHGATARYGSRAARFWSNVERAAEREIQRSLERDARLAEADS